MSELDQLISMLERAGFSYEKEPSVEHPGVTVVKVERGYSGFVTIFGFSADGLLIEMGAYE